MNFTLNLPNTLCFPIALPTTEAIVSPIPTDNTPAKRGNMFEKSHPARKKVLNLLQYHKIVSTLVKINWLPLVQTDHVTIPCQQLPSESNAYLHTLECMDPQGEGETTEEIEGGQHQPPCVLGTEEDRVTHVEEGSQRGHL